MKIFGRSFPRQKAISAPPDLDSSFIYFDGERMHTMKTTTMGEGGWSLPHNRSFQELRSTDSGNARAMAMCVWVFRCVSALVDEISQIPHYLEDIETGERVKEHPFLTAMDNAAMYHGMSLVGLSVAALSLWGENYIEKMRDPNLGGMSAGLKWLNNNAIEPDIQFGELAGFTYNNSDASTVYLKRDDVAYDHYFHPGDVWRGLGPLQTAIDSVNADIYIKRFVNAFFRNDAMPRAIVTAKNGQMMTPTDIMRVQSEWDEQFKGVDKKFKIAMLTAALDVQELQEAPSIAQVELEQSAREQICAAFGVPISRAGAWDSPRYQMSPETTRAFYAGRIRPEARRLADSFNMKILPFFDPRKKVRFVFDFHDIDALVEDAKTKAEISALRLNSGGISINEYRKLNGELPLPDGDVVMIPTNMQLVPVADLGKLAALTISGLEQKQELAEKAADTAAQMAKNPPMAGGGAPGSRANAPAKPKEPAKQANRGGKAQQEDADDELRAWLKKTLARGKACTFEAEFLPAEIKHLLDATLPELSDSDSFKGMFALAALELHAQPLTISNSFKAARTARLTQEDLDVVVRVLNDAGIDLPEHLDLEVLSREIPSVTLRVIPDSKELLEIFKIAQGYFNDRVKTLASQLVSGDLTVDAWEREMQRLIIQIQAMAMMIGRYDFSTINNDAVFMMELRAMEQFGYLHRFAELVAANPPKSANAVTARARLYGNDAEATFWENYGIAAGIPPMPFYPKQYTSCNLNCMCAWEYVKMEGSGNWDCYWRVSPVEHCPECARRAEVASPLQVRDGNVLPFDSSGVYR